MSIDHGKLLDAGVERLRQALKMHNEHRTTLQSLASSVGDFLRDYVALAKPAEAVELPTPYHYADGGKGEPLFTANQVRAAVAVATDAAQGAVATVCLVGERYAHGHMVSVELQLSGEDAPAPKIGDRYYTHPQAAPAQGDDAFLRRGLWECFKLAGGDTDGASGPEAIDNADLTIIAVRTVRDLRECYDELAAAPSQEGES